MTIKTNGTVLEHLCSMTAKGVMDIQFGKLFHVYIANVTAKPFNWRKFMIVVYA